MPSSFSPSLRANLQFPGEGINTWGLILNEQVITPLDYAIAGWLNLTVSADYSLTTANGSTDEARAAAIKLNGTPAANFAITIPSVSKGYFAFNNTAKVATITTGAGATVGIDAGDKNFTWCDGSGVHQITFGGLGLKDYIIATGATAGAVPSPIGSALKFLYVDAGENVLWRQPSTADLSDYEELVLGVQVALAVAL